MTQSMDEQNDLENLVIAWITNGSLYGLRRTEKKTAVVHREKTKVAHIPVFIEPPAKKQCNWHQEDSEHIPDTWRSDCGVLWTFTNGSPIQNNMKYCCGCGAKLRERKS